MASRRQRPLLDAGTRAPDFQLSRLEGGEASFAELAAGGPVLLVFFKVTCPVCQLTMPFLERLHASGALPIYGISQNDAADTREFNGYFGVSFATLLDAEDEDFPPAMPTASRAFPACSWWSRDGMISRVIEGWNKKDMESLAEAAGIAPVPAGATTFRRGRRAEVRATRFPAGATLNCKQTDGQQNRRDPRYGGIHRQGHGRHFQGDDVSHRDGRLSRRAAEVRRALPRRPRAAARRQRDGEVRGVLPVRRGLSRPTAFISKPRRTPTTARISGGERYAKVYNIDYNRCIFCGYCVEACPTDAITHGHGFEVASYNTSTLVKRKEDMLAADASGAGAKPPESWRTD